MSKLTPTFFNVTKSPESNKDVIADSSLLKVKKMPARFVWTRHLQDVRIQGVQGSSLAHVGSTMIEWKLRKIDKKTVRMSPQFIYNNRKDKDTNQMCGRELMEILKTTGCCSEKIVPHGSTKTDEIHNFKADQHKIQSFGKILTIEGLKRAILLYGPCLICLPVYNFNISMWKQHPGEEKLGGHAFAVVGFNKNGFILRNSWGSHWNGNGHALFSYKDWGLQDEIWTVIDERNAKHWKSMPERAMSKMSSLLKIPEKKDTEDEDAALYTTFKEKSNIKSETNKMKKTKKKAKKEEATEEGAVEEEAAEEEDVEEEAAEEEAAEEAAEEEAAAEE